MSILVVEDNPISAKVLDLNLSKAGYATILAVNGREALKCLELVPDIELVITDLSMPEMDGFTLVSTMREHPEWSRIPVLVAMLPVVTYFPAIPAVACGPVLPLRA